MQYKYGAIYATGESGKRYTVKKVHPGKIQ